MKKTLKIILLISLVLNVVLTFYFNRFWRSDFEPMGVDEVEIIPERKKFITEINTEFPETKTQKYYFIHLWSPSRRNFAKEMRVIDSLVAPYKNKFAFIFSTETHGDTGFKNSVVRESSPILFKHKFETKEAFAASVYQEKDMVGLKGFRRRLTPVNVIIDSAGELLFFDTLYATKNMGKDKALDAEFRKRLNEVLSSIK